MCVCVLCVSVRERKGERERERERGSMLKCMCICVPVTKKSMKFIGLDEIHINKELNGEHVSQEHDIGRRFVRVEIV